jgi:mycoredoxin
MPVIKIYGADWCHTTTETREHLDELGVAYQYINIERDPAAAKWVREQNHGKEVKPTLDIEGRILSEPSDEELDAALTQAGVSY